MKSIRKIICILFILVSFQAYAKDSRRDVLYTQSLYKLIEGYFNNSFETRENAELAYKKAVESVEEFPLNDTYSKETHLSRCDYYFGMYVMMKYDLTRLEHALDDISKEFDDPVENNRIIRQEADFYFKKAQIHSEKAMAVKEGSDAMTIYAQIISACCTVRNVAYCLGNALKINQYAKKAVKIDPLNATACFSINAQNIYGPGIFGNVVKGRKAMSEYLNNTSLLKEKFDDFTFTCAIAYSYYRQDKFNDALVWYKKCLDIYPANYAVLDMINKCEVKIKS